jgi:sugar diacid utilization regulator
MNYLNEILSNTQSVMGGDIYVVDDKGSIVITSNQDRIGTLSEAVNSHSFSKAYSFSTQTIDGKHNMSL